MKRVTFEQNYTGADLKAEAADYNEKLGRFACSPISDIFNVSHFLYVTNIIEYASFLALISVFT